MSDGCVSACGGAGGSDDGHEYSQDKFVYKPQNKHEYFAVDGALTL